MSVAAGALDRDAHRLGDHSLEGQLGLLGPTGGHISGGNWIGGADGAGRFRESLIGIAAAAARGALDQVNAAVGRVALDQDACGWPGSPWIGMTAATKRSTDWMSGSARGIRRRPVKVVRSNTVDF